MASVLIAGGGLAGLSAAAALASAGYTVRILESRPFLGGRATSWPVPGAMADVALDNCQHILLRCCVNLMDFYTRLGVADQITFHREFYFIEPGGRISVMKAGALPKPLHFTESFARLRFLSLPDKMSVARALLAIQLERSTRSDLDRITMLDWLQEKNQTRGAIERFWRQVLVSAINEELDRMAALHGFQVFFLGFLASSNSYEMGIPNVPLGSLYSEDTWKQFPSVEILTRHSVDNFLAENGVLTGIQSGDSVYTADHYVSALPVERLRTVAPFLDLAWSEFDHSPITGIHLWFDRPVTDLPHGTLLDRTMQWFFNKKDGIYLQLVVSASRSLVSLSRQEIIDLAYRELCEFLPVARGAKIVDAHVVKEVRATFSARPGLERFRPSAGTSLPNLTLAGDWTRSGWPATMEGAVRSGYKAAEHTTKTLGKPRAFLLPDIA